MSRLITASSLVVCFAFAPFTRAQDVQEQEPEELEEIEEIEEVEPEETSAETSVLDILGRMHPAAVHIPIGMIMALLVFDLLGLVFPKREAMQEAGLVLLVLIVFASVPAIITGLLRSWELERLGSTSDIREWHRNLMFCFAGISSLALGLRITKRPAPSGPLRWIYLGLITLAALVVFIGGHLGGKLVFGENHLPF